MASIKDAIEECIMDRNAVFKYLIIAVPLYMTYNTSLNGIKEGSAILEKLSSLTSADPYWGSAAALILFGMALITTHNVINTNNHVLPTANIFSFAFQTIIGFISLIPAIVFYSLVPGILIANLSKVVPENIANPINFIITAICQFCIFSAYIMYSKKYQFKDSLNFQVKRLSFQEQSGIQLNKLHFKILANKKEAKISALEIKLPDSNLKIDTLYANYSNSPQYIGWKEWFQTLHAGIRISNSFIAPNDLTPFVPALKGIHEPIHIKLYGELLREHIFFDEIHLYTKERELDARSRILLYSPLNKEKQKIQK